MKKLFTIALLILATGCLPGAEVEFNLAALGTSPATNRAILIRPGWLNPTSSIGLQDATILRTGTNQSVTLSNCPEAILSVEIMAPPARTVFSIYVPDTNGVLGAADLRGQGTGGRLDPNRYSWSVRASDARYARKSGITTSNSASVTFTGDGTSTNPLVGTFGGILTGTNYLGTIISSGTSTAADGANSQAFGNSTIASGATSHAIGSATTASGGSSHAQGSLTVASGGYSHAEGLGSVASGTASHAQGFGSTAAGEYSFAAGYLASALHDNTFVWSDGTEVSSSTNAQVTLNAANGYRLLGGPVEGRFIFTNAAGSRFVLIVNSSTNGLTFVPVP
jgi:hypothetical protein